MNGFTIGFNLGLWTAIGLMFYLLHDDGKASFFGREVGYIEQVEGR